MKPLTLVPRFPRPTAFALVATVLATLSGCASMYESPPAVVHQPMTIRPEPATQTALANGSIYQASAARPLFEDRRARRVGDTITINLVERTTAQKAANTTTGRSSSMAGGLRTIPGFFPFNAIGGLEVDAGLDSEFNGSGTAAANNVFNGTITVTVIETYANGNLLVSGEKQLAINQGNEFIRFSGIINPDSVTTSNTVQSTQVADARIEYKGSGVLAEHNTMGWLQRFFAAIHPF